MKRLRHWWDLLQESGPKFGYFPNAVKTHLLVKAENYEEAKIVFGDTAIQLSCEGKCYLGWQLALMST